MNQSMFFYADSDCRLLVTMILLEIVIVSPGTHFVKNHDSQSRTMSPSETNNASDYAWAFM